MRTLMRTPRSYLLLMVVALVLLTFGVNIAASRSTAASRKCVDCASDCRDTRDKLLEKCNELPESARDKCTERANKQYDKCMERCGE